MYVKLNKKIITQNLFVIFMTEVKNINLQNNEREYVFGKIYLFLYVCKSENEIKNNWKSYSDFYDTNLKYRFTKKLDSF